jgi:hypothetical protein
MGPKSNCPAARPIMQEVRLSCTIDVLVPNRSTMDGKAGRYISVTNGPKAVSSPRKTNRNIL